MTNQEIGQQVASTFADAFTAMARLPDIEKELAYYKLRNSDQEKTIDEYIANTSQLKDRIAYLEAALDDASKSINSGKDNLAILLDDTRQAIARLQSAVDLVDPPPPVVVPAPDPTPVGLLAATTGEDTSKPVETVVHEGYSPFVHDTPTSTESSPSFPEIGATTPSLSEGQSEPHPTTSHGPEPTSEAPSTSARTGDGAGQPQPKPYWYKPSSMTWADWGKSGGDVPHWAKDDDIQVGTPF